MTVGSAVNAYFKQEPVTCTVSEEEVNNYLTNQKKQRLEPATWGGVWNHLNYIVTDSPTDPHDLDDYLERFLPYEDCEMTRTLARKVSIYSQSKIKS
ncbi:MAG: hypothetical protein H7A37_07525 [Chlamydiales bacterium]|nr:hypothetical protein [Chlamydiia bacterium]MCP5508134.1 hypothetical protein [Chlamydiales bacterium]